MFGHLPELFLDLVRSDPDRDYDQKRGQTRKAGEEFHVDLLPHTEAVTCSGPQGRTDHLRANLEYASRPEHRSHQHRHSEATPGPEVIVPGPLGYYESLAAGYDLVWESKRPPTSSRTHGRPERWRATVARL